jgi:hypothetical protein
MPLVALSLVAILSFAALSIDLGALYEAKAEAQRAADAAALAAAQIISTEGVTTDPTNGSGNWGQLCGGPGSYASLAATNIANQNLIGGSPPTTVNVYYGTSAGTGKNKDCTAAATGFGINPVVSVYVQQTSLPNFFSRVFSIVNNGPSSNSGVSATAYAEAFNPSDSKGGNVIPVQPRCVKPWIVPNLDPLHGPNCTVACNKFVDLGTGSISLPGTYPGGVIGERFWLMPDCSQGPPLPPPPQCNLRSTPPQANFYDTYSPPAQAADLEYLPGQTSFAATAVPADGTAACSAASSPGYAQSIAGCDQTTVYACGQSSQQAVVNLVENPGISDTTNGVQCLTHQSGTDLTQLNGQDALLPTGTLTGGAAPYYPFEIQVGTSNPLIGAGVANNSVISSSNSIVSLPIYDANNTITQAGPNSVTIVGFLQVFINVVDVNGNVYVTVMNVSGCGNGVGGAQPLFGTSPVPVRLITPVPSS